MCAAELRPPILIESQVEFDHLVDDLRSNRRLAVDTESNSLHAYPERVCLVQLSTDHNDFLVDPLALDSLEDLGPLMGDPAVEKVFHAAEYDLACLHRDFGFRIRNLFDTRVACRTLGYPRTGLGDVLAQHFGVQLDKHNQRADWGRRPLSPALMNYARMDTHFLLPLRDLLAKELARSGRTEEAREECEWHAAQATVESPPAEGFWRIGRARQLPPDRQAVLRELYQWREAEARRLNRPPFKILSDKALLALTDAMPGDRRSLGRVAEVPERQRHRYAEALLSAVERGRQAPRPPRPAGRNSDEVALARYQRLRQWRKTLAESRNVESDVILPRDILWDIARTAPSDASALATLMNPLRWRFDQYGQAILEVLAQGPNGNRP
ncbi:MAG TPA: HRDC domain-containing protein [Anaerolineales bacterium]|nr:HRDC domain-containing protein [Anaerolineales bacterium]